MPEQDTYPTAEKAARAFGQRHGIKGGSGGWLRRYTEGGPASGEELFIHGWADLATTLVDGGVIDPQDGQGNSVRTERTRYGLRIHPAYKWRREATAYVITDREIKLGGTIIR